MFHKAKTRMFDIKSNYKKKYRSVLTCPFCMVQDSGGGGGGNELMDERGVPFWLLKWSPKI